MTNTRPCLSNTTAVGPQAVGSSHEPLLTPNPPARWWRMCWPCYLSPESASQCTELQGGLHCPEDGQYSGLCFEILLRIWVFFLIYLTTFYIDKPCKSCVILKHSPFVKQKITCFPPNLNWFFFYWLKNVSNGWNVTMWNFTWPVSYKVFNLIILEGIRESGKPDPGFIVSSWLLCDLRRVLELLWD